MSKLVIVGGSNGLGFAILNKLHTQYNDCVVFDIKEPIEQYDNVTFKKCDLSKDISSCYEDVKSADTLVITAGIGVVKKFENTSIEEIEKLFKVNTVSVIKILRAYYDSLLSNEDKKCFVMSSIAGEISSPLFATYGAAKSSISKICESLNIELEMSGSNNRITCGSAISFDGSSFRGKETDLLLLNDIADQCIDAMNNKKTQFYINEQLCLDIINRYLNDKHEFGVSSYQYKMDNNRLENRKLVKVGYLSGTFDLFHIGHLNLLRRAKEYCDYLVVGVHESGSWKGKETFIPLEERMAIVNAIEYADQVIVSPVEDSDAWDMFHYDYLFVGSDYKGTPRFQRYEEILKDKAKIIYFEYTQGTSSSQLRDSLNKLKNK